MLVKRNKKQRALTWRETHHSDTSWPGLFSLPKGPGSFRLMLPRSISTKRHWPTRRQQLPFPLPRGSRRGKRQQPHRQLSDLKGFKPAQQRQSTHTLQLITGAQHSWRDRILKDSCSYYSYFSVSLLFRGIDAFVMILKLHFFCSSREVNLVGCCYLVC